jgi:hypothetical protein
MTILGNIVFSLVERGITREKATEIARENWLQWN